MVQVDVFWSYAFGAGFAMAASRQLIYERRAQVEADAPRRPLLENRFFTSSLLYLSLLFAPSGIVLLWAFPSWETMHVWDRDLWAWMVALFAITNITQGILGFWVTRKLLNAGRKYAAFLQMPLGYFLMFFILVHGWDGTGYMRFFSATDELFANWSLYNIPAFFISDVAITLYLMGIVMLPVMFWMMGRWIINGYALDDLDPALVRNASIGSIAVQILKVVFLGALANAIIASLLIHGLGWGYGLGAFAIITLVVFIRPGGLLQRWAKDLLLV
ncbi:MAG: hypothetical protein P9M14_18370 [Candidatus Alcyoniella australis]|nr:hypothetical protein [Candidatus Alcyoniella australis]